MIRTQAEAALFFSHLHKSNMVANIFICACILSILSTLRSILSILGAM